MKIQDKVVKSKPYFIVVEEWKYPGEDGKNTLGVFDDFDRALDLCKSMSKQEYDINWEHETNSDDSRPERVLPDWENDINGYVITPKNGLDDWFYFCRVIEVNPFH